MAAPVTEEQLGKLSPFLAGSASPTGEVDMYCPMHADATRSAQLNLDKGLWRCHAGCGGGTVKQLIEAEGYWVPVEGRVPSNGAGFKGAGSRKPAERVRLADVRRWHEYLMDDVDGSGSRLHESRGIERSTALKFELGWDRSKRVYTIPVKSAGGKLWNVRRYSMDVAPGRRKIWGLRGRNEPRLYPASMVNHPSPFRIIVEGEWDALLTIQNGFPAITRTGAAHVWKPDWCRYFAGRYVYLCHDRDEMGDIANGRIAEMLEPYAAAVRTLILPYPWVRKHGRDLTDYWLDNHKPVEFQRLMESASQSQRKAVA